MQESMFHREGATLKFPSVHRSRRRNPETVRNTFRVSKVVRRSDCHSSFCRDFRVVCDACDARVALDCRPAGRRRRRNPRGQRRVLRRWKCRRLRDDRRRVRRALRRLRRQDF